MSTWATVADVTSRISTNGLLHLLDDDNDGSLEAADTALIEDAIADAETEIDAHTQRWIETPADASGSRLLKRIAVDIAVERLFGRKGLSIPDSVISLAEQSRDYLEKIHEGTMRIPGATYPTDNVDETEARRVGLPRITGSNRDGRASKYTARRRGFS